jgi:uncharacterized protein (TIGR02996 family)
MQLSDAIRKADLDDNTDRLMLADWMEEQGRQDEALLLRCEGLPLESTPEGKVYHNIDGSDESSFFRQYLDCILWTEKDANDKSLDDNGLTSEDFAPSAVVKAWKDCLEFYEKHKESVSKDPGKAGRNFWWNRNGHGTGFWCNWMHDEEVGQTLDTECGLVGECYCYVGDDGLIYLQ